MILRMNTPTTTELIDLLGGTTAVASLLGVKPPSVSEWKAKGDIPADKRVLIAPRIQKVSGGMYRLWDVCPDTWHLVWPELIGEPGAPAVPSEARAA